MMSEEIKITFKEAQLEFAKSIYNGIWDLLSKTNRSSSDNEDMLLSAYASLYHWKQVGTEVNLQRGYWMTARVNQTLGYSHQALEWALKCHKITQENLVVMKDFDLAYAEEGLARAYALAGDLQKAEKHYKLASDLGNKIQDPDDQKIFLSDLQGGNWYQLDI
jgi:tetratricopeptide (TPR) repeat protein